MSFATKQIPVLFFFSGMHRDYHTPSDDVDKINFDGLHQVTDLVEDVIYGIDKLPRQSYVATYDSNRMTIGDSGAGTRVRLGVMPDYQAQSSEGMRIADVSPGSPAAAAGLKAGDILLQFDDRKIQTVYDLTEVLANAHAGQKVRLHVLRGEQPLDLDATLAAQ
jgi:S1-C subfamily serine protease